MFIFLDFTIISILFLSPITILNTPLKIVAVEVIEGMFEIIEAFRFLGSVIVNVALETILGITEAIAELLPGTKFCIDTLDAILGIVELMLVSKDGPV